MAIERLLDLSGADTAMEALYTNLAFPEPPADRPYVYLNMVSTVDGKILIGPRGSTARGVGGPTDQMLMRRLEEAAEGAILGAGTLRTGPIVYPPRLWRAVITGSGDLPLDNRFFTDAPGRAIVFAPETLPEARRRALGTVAEVRLVGKQAVDVRAALGFMRAEFGVRRLVLEGGAGLNDDFFQAGLVDEMFLTLAPKIKGGANLPTPVDGDGLPGREYVELTLVSLYRDGGELYLRYRVGGRMQG